MDTYPTPVSDITTVLSSYEALYGQRPLAITEWGTINEGNDTLRNAAVDTFMTALKAKPYIYGFSYWTVTGDPVAAGNANENLLDKDTLAPIGPYQKVVDYFTGGSAQTGNYVAKAIAAATSSITPTDATTSAKGIVKLAGDLAGTADLPTVPGLASKQGTITVTTTGSSGAATFAGNVLNIPQYTSTGIVRSILPITASVTGATATSTDYIYYWTGSTAYTFTLPAGNTNVYTLKNSSTIAQAVSGSSDISTIRPGDSYDFFHDGTTWRAF